MKNGIYITIFSEKFPNQCKKQTNSKVRSNILPLCKAICSRATSIQHATLNQVNITKQIFLNIYCFPSTLVLLKYQDPFIEYDILVWALEFQHYSVGCEFQYHSLLKQGLS